MISSRAMHALVHLGALVLTSAPLLGCGDDDGGNAADRLRVGAQCTADTDCLQPPVDGGLSQRCLTQFKGGYCGIEFCGSASDCPSGSDCVEYDDGNNYCFRSCVTSPSATCTATRRMRPTASRKAPAVA